MIHKLGISNIITRITGTFVFDHQYIVYIRDQIWQTYVYVYMYIYKCICMFMYIQFLSCQNSQLDNSLHSHFTNLALDVTHSFCKDQTLHFFTCLSFCNFTLFLNFFILLFFFFHAFKCCRTCQKFKHLIENYNIRQFFSLACATKGLILIEIT